MTVTLVVAGAILGGLGLYEPLIEFAGAELPCPSAVWQLLVNEAIRGERHGIIGCSQVFLK